MTATEMLCNLLLNTNYEDIPEAVTRIAKERMLDTVGVILAGAVEPAGAGRIAVELVRELGGKPTSTVIGGGFRTSAPHAAFANGTSAATHEYDDASTYTVCHYSGALVPAVLAVGELTNASGKEILAAHVLAWEIGTRIGACLGGIYFFDRGFHPVGTWPCLGTAAAAAKMLSCNLEQTRMALGIAASTAGSIRRAYGTHTKPSHSGNAARNGIVAAMLARKGFTAHRDILDPDLLALPKTHGSFSFPAVFSGEGKYDLRKLTDRLGESYTLLDQPVTTHFYPGATGTAVFIELAIKMMRKHSFTADDVEKVEVKATRDWINGMSPFMSPETGDQARFSGPYQIAVALLDGRVGIEQHREARVHSPDVRELMQRVHISEVEGSEDVTRRIEETGDVTKSGLGELTIRLCDGRSFSEKGEQPKGSGELPLRRQDLLEKYRDCARRVLSHAGVARSIEMIENMEHLTHIAELMAVLKGRGRGRGWSSSAHLGENPAK